MQISKDQRLECGVYRAQETACLRVVSCRSSAALSVHWLSSGFPVLCMNEDTLSRPAVYTGWETQVLSPFTRDGWSPY